MLYIPFCAQIFRFHNRYAESSLPKWIYSMAFKNLNKRKSVVRLTDKHSKSFNVEKGVSQGSVLGPSIVCAYVSNFLPLSQRVTMVNYANDFCLILPLESRSENVTHSILQQETENLCEWCTEKKLRSNPTKSIVSSPHEFLPWSAKIKFQMRWVCKSSCRPFGS